MPSPDRQTSSAATKRDLPYALRVQLACSYWQQATTTSPLPKEIR